MALRTNKQHEGAVGFVGAASEARNSVPLDEFVEVREILPLRLLLLRRLTPS